MAAMVVFSRNAADMPPESEVCSQKSNALRLASTINLSHNQLSFAGEKGQEDPPRAAGPHKA